MSRSRKDPLWKTLEGVEYTLDKVSYMVDNPVKPSVKPAPIVQPKSPEKSPVLPRNTGINRGKLMRQLEETSYFTELRENTLRRELREVIPFNCTNEAIEDFCQPSIAERRFKYSESYCQFKEEETRELPPVHIPEVEEYEIYDPSQFEDAEISKKDELSKESNLFSNQLDKVKEPNSKSMNSFFRNRVNLICRNALIHNLKKEKEEEPTRTKKDEQ